MRGTPLHRVQAPPFEEWLRGSGSEASGKLTVGRNASEQGVTLEHFKQSSHYFTEFIYIRILQV